MPVSLELGEAFSHLPVNSFQNIYRLCCLNLALHALVSRRQVVTDVEGLRPLQQLLKAVHRWQLDQPEFQVIMGWSSFVDEAD